MKCPYCGYVGARVIDSRPADDGSFIRRRRECVSCGERFTTYEKVENIQIVVIKKDNTRESFDRSKIQRGVMRACEKRKVTMEQIDELVDSVEQQLTSSMSKEVSSDTIGQMIMERLKNLDKVAYVRFASVYREFKDVDTFMEELKKMINKE
jgi:transcriptional repressor NrdR